MSKMLNFHIKLIGNDRELKDWNGRAETASIAKTKAMETFGVPVTAIQFCKVILTKYEKMKAI